MGRIEGAEMKLALELLTEAAANPCCDELFARVPELSISERRALIERERAARASWGTVIEEEEVYGG